MSDDDLAAKIAKIKDYKPEKPGGLNCIDFTFDETDVGVRIVLTYNDAPEKEHWTLSNSVGVVTPGVYTPMLLKDWTVQSRQLATAAVFEVLDYFNIDDSTRKVKQGHSVMLFKFKEIDNGG